MKKHNEKLMDLIGAACGILLAVIMAVCIISSNTTKTVGDTNVSAEAQTLTGTAQGRNGPVEVEVVADAERIYQISVLNHEETEGLGTVAVEKLPPAIYENQSLAVDAIAGATITSDAIKAAVIAALESGGLDPSVFQNEVAAAAPA